jgi:DNA-binding transcriptional ArsR family regulator
MHKRPAEHLTPDRLDATFAALAHPARRAILARLASGEASVTELAEPFAMSQPAISRHLRVLERARGGSRPGRSRTPPSGSKATAGTGTLSSTVSMHCSTR